MIHLPTPRLNSRVHSLIYAVAKILHEAGATLESAKTAIHTWRNDNSFRPGRIVTDTELNDTLFKVYAQGRCPRSPLRLWVRPSQNAKWPTANPKKRSKLLDPDFGLQALRDISPVNCSDGKPHTRAILETLFPGDPLVCCGWSKERFDTRPLSHWLNPEKFQFIVPNPMSKPRGARQSDGRLSARTKDNTGARRFLVIDYDDHAGADIHASASVYLAQSFPLALVLSSGGKSLHAWYYIQSITDEELLPFMAHACELGGDPAMFNRSQFCRMPDGLRDNGTRQTIYYFNPEATK